MFIYLVFPVVTLFILFGVLHDRNEWLRSSVRHTLALYHRMINRCTIQHSLLNEDHGSSIFEEDTTSIRAESDDVPAHNIAVSKIADHTKEISRDAILSEGGTKMRTLNPLQYSFGNTVSEEEETNFDLPVIKTLPLEKTQNASRVPKQDETKNIFESLEATVEKVNTNTSSRLNTKQIYNLLMEETLKENEARLLTEMKEQVPSPSENKSKTQENKTK